MLDGDENTIVVGGGDDDRLDGLTNGDGRVEPGSVSYAHLRDHGRSNQALTEHAVASTGPPGTESVGERLPLSPDSMYWRPVTAAPMCWRGRPMKSSCPTEQRRPVNEAERVHAAEVRMIGALVATELGPYACLNAYDHDRPVRSVRESGLRWSAGATVRSLPATSLSSAPLCRWASVTSKECPWRQTRDDDRHSPQSGNILRRTSWSPREMAVAQSGGMLGCRCWVDTHHDGCFEGR